MIAVRVVHLPATLLAVPPRAATVCGAPRAAESRHGVNPVRKSAAGGHAPDVLVGKGRRARANAAPTQSFAGLPVRFTHVFSADRGSPSETPPALASSHRRS